MTFKKLLIASVVTAIFLLPIKALAICANYTTYATGQVLTSSSLNSLQTNYTNCVNNVLDGDTFTGTMNYHSGADINVYSDAGSTLKAQIDGATGTMNLRDGADVNVYSDAGSTLKAQIDGATGDVILSPRTLGTAINCEINYAGGTITISGRGGVALSATNPCHIGIRSNSNGVVATATFTANVTVTDGAASQTDGNLFGITDANWANAMPMFFGVIYDGSTPYFTLSRTPERISGSAGSNLCQLNDTDCDAEYDVMILTTGLTLANWVTLPITQVAWLQATYATSGGAWTFAETTYTGFNKLYEGISFKFPTAQMGAVASYHFKSVGTPPTWATPTSISYTYHIDENCRVSAEFSTSGAGNATNGTGANALDLTLPYTIDEGADTNGTKDVGCGTYKVSTTAADGKGGLLCNFNQGDTAITLFDSQGTDAIPCNGFSATTDDLRMMFEYNCHSW